MEKRNYSRKLLFVDKPDIYDASVRWVFASAVLKDSSTQPRFMNAEVLMIQILMLHDELLAALYISRVHWLSADLSEERSLWSRRTRHMIRPKDRSQAPYTLNTHLSAVKLSNFTHKRVMKQVQAIFPGFLVSSSCNSVSATPWDGLTLERWF